MRDSWLRRLWRIPSGRRLLLVEAVVTLGIARLAVRVVPFPRIARWLGTVVSSHDVRVPGVAAARTRSDAEAATAIRWAICCAARHVPFRAVCLPQALAAHAMLRRRGVRSVMHFGGVIGGGPAVEAHAWLDAAGVKVTGYPIPSDIAEIACFI